MLHHCKCLNKKQHGGLTSHHEKAEVRLLTVNFRVAPAAEIQHQYFGRVVPCRFADLSGGSQLLCFFQQ